MNAKDRAKKALIHYFALLFKQAELRWDNDNTVEIEGIVDDILEAVWTSDFLKESEGE